MKNSKISVLFVAPYGGVPGGISRWMSHVIDYHKSIDSDVELDLVSMGRSTFVSIKSNPIYRLYAAFKDYRGILKDFHNHISHNTYDVMHLTSSGSWSLVKDIYMIKAAKRHKIKTIVHFRFGRIPDLKIQDDWEWKLVKKVVSLVDKAIIIDNKTYKTLEESGFQNLAFLPNPISREVCTIVERNKDIQREKRLILFTGHAVLLKGVYELIEACKSIPNLTLKIVGHVLPDMKKKLQDMAGPNSEWLHIVGEEPYEEVIKDMLRCELFVLPTHTEGFPNVILESMACGCPIITTPVGAIPDMLDIESETPCGICVPVKDPLSLRNQIEYLLDHKEEATAMGQRAQDRVNNEYSMQYVWKKMENIWRSIL